MKRPPKQKRSWLNICRHLRTVLLVFMFSICSCNIIQAQKVHCELRKVSDSIYAGLCQCKDSLVFALNLKRFPLMGQTFWKGQSTLKSMRPMDPIFLEVHGDSGTIGTQYLSLDGDVTAWYKISGFKNDDKQLQFFFDLTELSKPSNRDIIILQRVKKYLSDSLKWNRNDNRYFAYIDCQPNSKQKSLFCALYAAQTDILGDFYGGPTFWALANAINKHGEFQHPFQGFNNDLKVSFSILQSVIDDAIVSIKLEIETK